jgi:hypothetical protein
MGISSKWIKSLVRIKRQDKGQHSQNQEKAQNADSSETVSHGIRLGFIVCNI